MFGLVTDSRCIGFRLQSGTSKIKFCAVIVKSKCHQAPFHVHTGPRNDTNALHCSFKPIHNFSRLWNPPLWISI